MVRLGRFVWAEVCLCSKRETGMGSRRSPQKGGECGRVEGCAEARLKELGCLGSCDPNQISIS